MHFVIFTGGQFQTGVLAQAAIQKADRIIAADSGAKTALSMNIHPTVVIGDFDSLDKKSKEKLEKKGCEFITLPVEKDETDTDAAIQFAIKNGAKKITLLGGTSGDRFDHVITNLLSGVTKKANITFINGLQKFWIEKDPAVIYVNGKKGDLLSLIPLSGKATGMHTKNLYYPLKNETLYLGKSRGVSNVFTKSRVEVRIKSGLLLVVYTSV